MEIKNSGMTNERHGIRGLFDGFMAELSKRRTSTEVLLWDLAVFLVSFLFAGCHLAFGAYPVGIALVAALPSRVFVGLLGAVAGALALGRSGAIFAIIAVLVAFLRIIISGGGHEGEEPVSLFRENLLLRMSAAVVGGFISGVYRLLLSGFTVSGVLFALAMILTSGALTLGFGALFLYPVTAREIAFGDVNILSASHRLSGEGYRVVLFQASFLLYTFFIAFSLRAYALFGISFSHLFLGLLTLFLAKRFGALRAAVGGFVSALGVSGMASVAFALSGLAAGLLFRIGLGIALVGAVAAGALWGAYSEGVSGLLEIFPELSLSALLGVPFYKKIVTERSPEGRVVLEARSADMVRTMALSGKSRANSARLALEGAMMGVAPLLRELADADARPSYEDYYTCCLGVLQTRCKTCDGFSLCEYDGEIEGVAKTVAKRMARGEKILPSDLTVCRSGEDTDELLSALSRACSRVSAEMERARDEDGLSELFAIVSKMQNEAYLYDEEEFSEDTALSEGLEDVFVRAGFSDGTVRAFGKRRRTLIGAGEDADGSKITSPALHSALEEAMGARLGVPEYFRKENMVLMRTVADRKFSVKTASVSYPKGAPMASGDSMCCFESGDGRFFALLCDGMGSGEEARRTSQFAVGFLKELLSADVRCQSAMALLNCVLKTRRLECSVTVDLFEYDLITGEGQFYKSGAAPAYVKRASSIFRIESRTLPLGVLPNVDAERIRAEITPGDYVVLLSDGVAEAASSLSWLPELLHRPVTGSPSDFAEQILRSARSNGGEKDDMSVIVLYII